eukprot:scaffold29769_cov84-Isochrysis_galbana.AAC.1
MHRYVAAEKKSKRTMQRMKPRGVGRGLYIARAQRTGMCGKKSLPTKKHMKTKSSMTRSKSKPPGMAPKRSSSAPPNSL